MEPNTLITAWIKAAGGPARWARRLAWDGWRESDVLAHLLARLPDPFPPHDVAAEVESTYHADRPALSAWLGAAPGSLQAITPGLSDPHNGGRTVCRVTTSSGMTLYYKPRPVHGETAFHAVCTRLSEWLPGIETLAPPVLDRGSYGWVRAHIPQPADADAASRAFGWLVALAYLLKAEDLHTDNVIWPEGAMPAVVDLETLAAPHFPSLDGEPPGGMLSPVDRPAPDTILDPGLLSFYVRGPAGYVDAAPAKNHPIRIEAFEAGLREALMLARQYKTDLFDAVSRHLEGRDSRLLLRHTGAYYLMLNHVKADPVPLRAARLDGLLSRAYTLDAAPPVDWSLHREEWSALLRGDIPRLTRPVDLDKVRARLELPDDGIEAQVRVARAVIAASPVDPAGQSVPFTRGTMLIDHITSAILPGPDGPTLIGPAYDHRIRAVRPRMLGPSPYDGLPGVALFLHAAGHADTADHLLTGLRGILANPDRAARLAKIMSLGLDGMGGLIYALTVADHTGDAARAARLITGERIKADTTLDLMGGSAGALLGLLALYARSGDVVLLDLAKQADDHLRRAAVTPRPGQVFWMAGGGRPLCGMAHGASGFGMALARLAAVTGNDDLLPLVEDAVTWEAAQFDPDRREWPDLRHPQPRFKSAWCHGGPGIVLARLAMLAVLDTPQIRADIRAGLEVITTQEHIAIPNHLCCGLTGHVSILITAAHRLDRPDLLEHARRIINTIDVDTLADNPTLFRGLAGLGYTLLRLDDPTLPDVLTLGRGQ